MPQGLSAKRKGDEIEIVLSDGTAEERLRMWAIELAEALARLEAPGYPTMDPGRTSRTTFPTTLPPRWSCSSPRGF